VSSSGECELRGVVLVDEEDEASVEGTVACDAGGGEFDFSADDEDGGFVLLVTPYDESGTPRLDLATLYYAVKGEAGPPADTNAAGGSTTRDRSVLQDSRLVGVWSTQVMMNTPGGSMATQLLMEVRADGVLVDLGSRSIGGTPDVNVDTGLEDGGETARWRANGDVLEVSYAGSRWIQLARYELSGDRLLLDYYDGDRRLWHRQR
jgi:hypothetical protein